MEADAANGFRKPATKLYRSFLYLDSDEVLNSLSALEGGDVDEVLTKTGSEGAGGLEGQVGAGPLKAKGGKKSARKFEEEMKVKRTIHSAASTLLRKLEEAEAIGVIEGDYGPAIYEELEEHMLLEFTGSIQIHPLNQAATAAHEFKQLAPHYGVSKQEIRELSEILPLLNALSGGGDRGSGTLLVFADAGGGDDYRLVLRLRSRHVLVDLDDLSGRATFVAQVDRVLAPGEEVLAMRLLGKAPQLDLERQALDEGLATFVSALKELGLSVTEKDFVLTSPTVLLKPICVYK
jgi:hypothetical protein